MNALRRLLSDTLVKTCICVALLLGLTAIESRARVWLPSIFADHMVLQQNTRIKIWGWADPWETATVKPSWSDQVFKIKGDGNASWQFYVDTPAAGGPYTLTITAEDGEFTIRNIMIGEVWLCAGQSNMEWSAKHGVKDAIADQKGLLNPALRLFKMRKRGSEEKQADVEGTWSVCDSAALRNFSAVGYFFGKQLNRELKVPVGLVDMAWGGSYIESWIPRELVELYPDCKKSADIIPPTLYWPNKAGAIYNGMVAPLTDFRIAGVIWYQGESNTHNPPAYYTLQHLMVENWRRANATEFPFYYVQIAPFQYPQDSTGKKAAYVREMQEKALDLPKSGMVISTDLVDNLKDVHPIYKAEVGRRLANWALNETYQVRRPDYKSPSFAKKEIRGNKVLLTFRDVSEKGLEFRKNEVMEFEIADRSKKFTKANARVVGKNQVEVWANDVTNPVAVRFAFSNSPSPTLFDKSGLPVVPFRTDEW